LENPVTNFELYVGRGVWIPGDSRSAYPANAVPAGNEADGTPLLAIRSKVDKALVPGKYSVKTGEAWVSLGGKEVVVSAFEFLVRNDALGAAAQPPNPAPAPDAWSASAPEAPMTDENSLALQVARFLGSSRLLVRKDVTVLGGAAAVAGELTSKDYFMDLSYPQYSLKGAAIDVYTLRLDDKAQFSLSFSSAAPPKDFQLLLLDSRGNPVGQQQLVGTVTRLYGQLDREPYLTLVVLQAAAKAPGSYGFNLQETYFELQGELAGDAFDQRSLVPLALDPSYGSWTVGMNAGGFDPLFDILDSKGKVVARSVIVDPEDRVAQIEFTPSFRGMAQISVTTRVPTQDGAWRMVVSAGGGM
jgi:hypothetical protein